MNFIKKHSNKIIYIAAMLILVGLAVFAVYSFKTKITKTFNNIGIDGPITPLEDRIKEE